MSLHKSYVHGNSALLEHPGAGNATGKHSVGRAFDGDVGDIIDLGGAGGAACLRLGWGSRFVIFDTGRKNYKKSGYFWCHFAIPTPVVEDGKRARTRGVEINYESTDINAICIGAVHIWDGNRRIRKIEGPTLEKSASKFNGGISKYTTDFKNVPNQNRVWKESIPDQFIFFGLGVSILIRAHQAKDSYLEIRGVGVDFEIRD